MDNNTDMLFVVPAITKRVKEESIGTLILARKAQLAGYRVEIARYWNTDTNPKSDYSNLLIQFCVSMYSFLSFASFIKFAFG